MRALTMHQPHASLFALGVRTIETRSWTTSYRGDLLIHAAVRKPEAAIVGDYEIEQWAWGSELRFIGECGIEQRGPSRWPLPLGAVVAVARLVDCVPMQSFATHDHAGPHLFVEPGEGLALWTPEARTIVEDQRPYGDFRPGRFALLLDRVRALPEPAPAKGKQGLWTPDAELLEAVAAPDPEGPQ